jgi:Sensors of blue-light using FAD.
MSLHQYTYMSKLVGDVTPAIVSKLVHSGRIKNRAAGVGSVLIFDGWRFFQYLEGTRDAVLSLAALIRTDNRHDDFDELYQAASPGVNTLTTPGLDYALCYDDSLDGFATRRNAGSVNLLQAILPGLDLTTY